MSLHFIQQFNIAQLVPTSGATTTFAAIAAQCGLPEVDVRRLLRHAMTIRVFDEPREGEVIHTRASMLLREEGIHGWIGSTCQNGWPSATRVSLGSASTHQINYQNRYLTTFFIDRRIVEEVSRIFGSHPVGESSPFASLPRQARGAETDENNYSLWQTSKSFLTIHAGLGFRSSQQ